MKQNIDYKLSNPYQLPILTSQLHAQLKELPWEMVSHPYLIFRNMQDI